jgi:hypothetical protein
MIDFTTVTREFRSLVHRRRHLLTFLGSTFAGTGIFLQNVLHGGLPASMKGIGSHIFAYYTVFLLVPSLVLALRMAKLHAGMVLNGILYSRLMQEQTFTRPGDPRRAARHNFLSVAFLQFLLTDLIAGFSAAILGLAVALPLGGAVALGVGVFLACMALYFRFHHQAVAFAFRKIETDTCGPFDQPAWREHVSTSLEDANTSMLADLGFVGLMVFSVFEKLSGLNEIKLEHSDLASADVQRYGPLVFASLLLVTCVIGLFVHLRVRVAIGMFSIQLDPTDRPFRPLRLTDSLLGYLLLAFLFAVSVHVLLLVLLPELETAMPVLLGMDAGALILAVLIEQATLVIAGRRVHST